MEVTVDYISRVNLLQAAQHLVQDRPHLSQLHLLTLESLTQCLGLLLSDYEQGFYGFSFNLDNWRKHVQDSVKFDWSVTCRLALLQELQDAELSEYLDQCVLVSWVEVDLVD